MLVDMPGIDPLVMVHQLNVNPMHRLFKQKKQNFAPEHQKMIAEKVDNLLDAGFIKETTYLEWNSNMFMVKKMNDK